MNLESPGWDVLLTNHKNFYRVGKEPEATIYLDALKMTLQESCRSVWLDMVYASWKAAEDTLRVDLSRGITTARQAADKREVIDRTLFEETEAAIDYPYKAVAPRPLPPADLSPS